MGSHRMGWASGVAASVALMAAAPGALADPSSFIDIGAVLPDIAERVTASDPTPIETDKWFVMRLDENGMAVCRVEPIPAGGQMVPTPGAASLAGLAIGVGAVRRRRR